MAEQQEEKLSKSYVVIVVSLMLVLPCVSVLWEALATRTGLPLTSIAGKWFLFWGVGMRLFTAGIKQAINPAFTARSIFKLSDKDSFVIVKELGFANICMGSVALISLFMPGWRAATAFTGGLYMSIAGINHIIKKPAGANEWVALVSDVFIGVVMGLYVASVW